MAPHDNINQTRAAYTSHPPTNTGYDGVGVLCLKRREAWRWTCVLALTLLWVPSPPQAHAHTTPLLISQTRPEQELKQALQNIASHTIAPAAFSVHARWGTTTSIILSDHIVHVQPSMRDMRTDTHCFCHYRTRLVSNDVLAWLTGQKMRSGWTRWHEFVCAEQLLHSRPATHMHTHTHRGTHYNKAPRQPQIHIIIFTSKK